MQKTVKLLAVILAAQLLLAVLVIWSNQGLSARGEATSLITVAAQEVNRITLEGADNAKVVLTRKGDVWSLPDAEDFPADKNRIEQFIERLGGLQAVAPVATTRGAQERFKVSDEVFERRITLADGDDVLTTLYLGSSPQIRHIHAREQDQDAIYSVEMAAHEAPLKTADWEDKGVLQLPQAQITALQVGGLQLRKVTADAAGAASSWQAASLEPGKRVQSEAVDELARLLAGLRFDSMLGRQAKTEYGLENPVMQVTLTRAAGDTLTYRLGKTAEQEEYTLKVSNRAQYFRLASYTARPLIDAARLEQLVAADSVDTSDDGAAQPPQQPADGKNQ